MLFLGDKLVSFERASPRDRVPELEAFYQAHFTPGARDRIMSHSDSFHFYDGWEIDIEYAPIGAFKDLLSFFVNTGAGSVILQDSQWRDWLWNELETPARLEQTFRNKKIRDALAEQVKSRAAIVSGWLMHRSYGRVDEDVTYSVSRHLFETHSHFVYLRYREDTLH